MNLYLSNDHILELAGLRNGMTGAHQTGGTVQATLTDADAVEITGQTWPLTLEYVDGTPGTYRGQIQDTLSVSAGDDITATITAQADGLTATWHLPLTVSTRRS